MCHRAYNFSPRTLLSFIYVYAFSFTNHPADICNHAEALTHTVWGRAQVAHAAAKLSGKTLDEVVWVLLQGVRDQGRGAFEFAGSLGHPGCRDPATLPKPHGTRPVLVGLAGAC